MAKKVGPGPGSKKKKKSKSSLGPEAVALKRQRAKAVSAAPNPFETIWTRKKFDVVGKKQKGAGRKIGQARAAAVDKRKKTLLEEYKQRGKSNAFLDHRFGERDDSLTEDDKAILRFQRERQAQINRGSRFALTDDDDKEEFLTHMGAPIAAIDDFQDDVSVDDDEGGGDAFEDLRFGGGVFRQRDGNQLPKEAGEHHKSKKEIMEEVIAKSKFYKAQKAKEKEEDQDLKEKLDKDFASLAQTQALLSLVRPKKVNALKAMLLKPSPAGAKDNVNSIEGGDPSVPEKEVPDDYEKLMKDMVFDIRARASDRLKTAEEVVKEEKARLEELEKKRRKRMLGIDTSESENEDSDDEGFKKKRKKRREISGDDLGENFVLEDEEQTTGWVDEVLARKGGEDEHEDDEDDEDGSGSEDGGDEDPEGSEGDEGSSEAEQTGLIGGEEHDWEQSDDETIHADDLAKAAEDNGTRGNKGNILTALERPESAVSLQVPDAIGRGRKLGRNGKETKKAVSGAVVSVDGSKELPYVIEAPQSLDEFRQLVDGRSDEELVVAVQRIRTCNAISLAAQNRKKMQVFYGVLLQYFAALATESTFAYSRLNAIVKPLLELGSATPYFAAQCARQRIVRMQTLLSEKLRNPDGTSCWPSIRTLLLLRLWSMNFPPSDFRHVVMTPAMLLMSQYLIRCPVNSGRDVAIGVFLCSLVLSVMRSGRRFCPEALSFMYAMLLSALPSGGGSKDNLSKKYCPAFMLQLVGSRSWLLLHNKDGEVKDVDFVSIVKNDDSSPIFETDVFRVGVLYALLQNLKGFMGIYDDLISFPETFRPFMMVLRELASNNNLPDKVQLLGIEIREKMEDKVREHETLRQPLRMRVKTPVPIKQFNPRFEEDFAIGRDYDPDRERAEKKKLQRLVKREAKGAARELRKDNQFLQQEKIKERVLADAERTEKYRKAMSFLQEQEHAFKSGQLGKGRKKRRK